MIAARVQSHCWRRQFGSGQAKSIVDLAEQEDVADTYVLRPLQLTCFSTDVVEAILDGQQPKGLRLAERWGGVPLS